MTLTSGHAPSPGRDLPSSCSPRPATMTVPLSFSPMASHSPLHHRRWQGGNVFRRRGRPLGRPHLAQKLASRATNSGCPPQSGTLSHRSATDASPSRDPTSPRSSCAHSARPGSPTQRPSSHPTRRRHLLLSNSHRGPFVAFLHHPTRFVAAAPA